MPLDKVEGQETPEQELKPEVPETEEAVKEEVVAETSEYTETEELAMAQGWKPLSEWKGDPKDHRSAKEYLDRGELLGKIKSQNQQLSEVRAMLTHMSEHNKKVYHAGYEKALKDLQARKMEAVKEADVDTVEALDKEIDATKEAIAEIKSTPEPKRSTSDQVLYQDWLKSNSWYLNDPSLRHWANGMAIEYNTTIRASEGHNATEEEIYNYLTKMVRKEFPHKFGKARQAPPSPDGKGRQSGGKSSEDPSKDFDALLASMPEDQRDVAKSLVKSGVITKEKYIQDYKAVGG